MASLYSLKCRIGALNDIINATPLYNIKTGTYKITSAKVSSGDLFLTFHDESGLYICYNGGLASKTPTIVGCYVVKRENGGFMFATEDELLTQSAYQT